jgi:hypothetical protein
MASKGRHLADFLSDDTRGKDLGASQVEIKGNKAKAQAVVRMGQSKNDDLLVANTSSDRIGIQTTNPQAVLDVEGDVRIGTDLEDNTGRVFKVYYANGDISWGE